MIARLAFTHRARPMRVVFGTGTVRSVPDEVRALGATRPLVVTTPGRSALAHEIAADLDRTDPEHPDPDRAHPHPAEVYLHAEGHVPAPVGAAAVARARAVNADVCVAVGGGAAIGLAKIITRDTGIPMIAVPTTYSGSEMTPVWGETRDGRKLTGSDERVLARSVIYDPDLTRSLPDPCPVRLPPRAP